MGVLFVNKIIECLMINNEHDKLMTTAQFY